MANVIAKIRLAHGETGYYDDKTGICLNWSHPDAVVTDDMNVNDLRCSARCGRILVVDGTLGKPKSFKDILLEAKEKRFGKKVFKVKEDAPAPKEEVKPAPVQKAEEKPAEPSAAEASEGKAEEQTAEAEATGAEEKPAARKTTRRRKTAKKTADAE